MIFRLLCLAALLHAPITANAADKSKATPAPRMLSIRGSCETFKAPGRDNAKCQHEVVNVNFTNGRVIFVFVARDSNGDPTGMTFSGDGRRQVKIDADNVTMPIDSVEEELGANGRSAQAVGACRFANPYKGTAVVIHCSATTTAGDFEGRLLSNGRPPADIGAVTQD